MFRRDVRTVPAGRPITSPYFSRRSILFLDFFPEEFRRPGRLFRRVPWCILGSYFLSWQAVAACPTQFGLAWCRSLPVPWFPFAQKTRLGVATCNGLQS